MSAGRFCRGVLAGLLAALLTGCGGGGGGTTAPPPLPDTLTVIVPSLTPQYSVRVERDIVYATGVTEGGASSKDLLLDIYYPEEATVADNKQFPLMLMMHGGFFQFGSKANTFVTSAAQEYAQRGWLVAAINYRLQSDDPVPSSRMDPLVAAAGPGATAQEITAIAAVDDAINALAYMEQTGDAYMPWATLWGYSAGAFIALISGYSLDDFGIPSVGAAAVIDIAGGIQGAAVGTPFDDPAGADPVLMIIHGTEDGVVPFDNAEFLRDAAMAAGLPLDYQPIAGGGHTVDLFNTDASTGASLFQRSVDWLGETVLFGQLPGPLVIE